MIKFYLSISASFILLFCTSACAETKEPPAKKVCLNMIVKDETKVITRCIESVLPLIDTWIIVDTGSTDGTQQMIKDYMKEKGIPGTLYERPWVNFGHNRNEALALAKDAGDYILFMDADEYLVFDPNYKRPNLDKDYYYVSRKFSGMTYARIMLVSTHKPWEWVGVLHEVLVPPPATTFATLENVVNVCTTEGARSRDPLKYQKDAKLLEAELEKNPNHGRNRFYLAQSYRDAGMPEEAIKQYEKRVAMGGWDQEVYCSLLAIARLQEQLEMPSEIVIASYNRAYQYRSSRVEPLYHLATLLRKQEKYEAAYKITQIAFSMPVSNDALFVETWITDYGIALERSIDAYWLGKYKECQIISQQLLTRNDLPQCYRECIERNLACANAKLVEHLCTTEAQVK
jgi:tetratricopeptide (TPR) repeat protein